MRQREVEVRKQKVVIGSDESPKYFWEPELEPDSARGPSLQALSSFPREGEGGAGKRRKEEGEESYTALSSRRVDFVYWWKWGEGAEGIKEE